MYDEMVLEASLINATFYRCVIGYIIFIINAYFTITTGRRIIKNAVKS